MGTSQMSANMRSCSTSSNAQSNSGRFNVSRKQCNWISEVIRMCENIDQGAIKQKTYHAHRFVQRYRHLDLHAYSQLERDKHQ